MSLSLIISCYKVKSNQSMFITFKFEEIEKLLESANLNFLIGSGASRPFLDTLQDIEKAMESFDRKDGFGNDQTNQETLKIIEASIKNHYFTKCIEKNLKLISAKFCNEKEPCDKDLNKCKVAHEYKIFLESLQTILSKRSNNYPKQVNLFTTNIDVFLDVALEECRLSFNDGFSGRMNPKFGTENFHNIVNKVSSHYDYQSTLPLFNLFKLHGSLNWKWSEDKTNIYYDNQLSAVEKLKGCNLAKESLVECFDENGKFLSKKDNKDHGFSAIYEEATKIKNSDSKIKEFIEAYDKLVMINPNKDKFKDTTLKLHYYELLRMFSNNIDKENSVLFVFGFSFADEHICEIVNRAVKSNPTLLVVIFAYSENTEKRMREEKETRDLINTHNVVFVARFTKEEKGNRKPINIFDLETINKEFFEKIANSLGKSKDGRPVVNVVVQDKKEVEKDAK